MVATASTTRPCSSAGAGDRAAAAPLQLGVPGRGAAAAASAPQPRASRQRASSLLISAGVDTRRLATAWAAVDTYAPAAPARAPAAHSCTLLETSQALVPYLLLQLEHLCVLGTKARRTGLLLHAPPAPRRDARTGVYILLSRGEQGRHFVPVVSTDGMSSHMGQRTPQPRLCSGAARPKRCPAAGLRAQCGVAACVNPAAPLQARADSPWDVAPGGT